MSNMTHTPGPWLLSTQDYPPIVYATRGSDERDATAEPMVALVDGGPGYCNLPVQTAEANARLIAAAPDLLAALVGLGEAMRDFDGADVRSMLPALLAGRAAIAKAQGRP